MYDELNNTYFTVPKNDPKDMIHVEIGDSKQAEFYPQIKIMRWDNEANVSFRLKDNGLENETVTTDNNKIIWSKGSREAHFYEFVDAEHPDGASELEIILTEKPTTNVVEFTLNTKGLDFFYQPALTEEDIAEGVSRPDNVVGSYAVYTSEQKINYVNGKEYKCGKVGHIYRPQVEDAKGTKVWGDLNINTETGILSVTIPQHFLDKAVYPVRHAAGLTFGYTSVGASSTSWSQNLMFGNVETVGASGGSVDSISCYWSSGSASNAFKGVLTSSSKVIITDGVSDPGTVDTTATWYTATYSTKPSISGSTQYLICAIHNKASNMSGRFDLTTWGRMIDSTNSYATPTDPTDGTSLTNARNSIYATYTVGGASAFPVAWLTA